MITYLATAGLNAIILALTPIQRWSAARQFNSNFTNQRLFILAGVAVVTILTVLLVTSMHRRKSEAKKAPGQLFADKADKAGLSSRECQILKDITKEAGLERDESIFVTDSAFDQGTIKLIEKALVKKGVEESKKLRSEVSFLREKLGFQKRFSASVGLGSSSKKLSSRQIPVGKTVHISHHGICDSSSIEATVIENSEMEFSVKPEIPLETVTGDTWRVRYYFGSSVWELDTSIISYEDEVMVLNHRDNIRLVNRRRFLRASINRPAFIAHFPFAKTIVGKIDTADESSDKEQSQADVFAEAWKPPEFVPATVRELAGPGLRIEALMETSMEVSAGDKVLVVFRMDERRAQGPELQQAGEVPKTKVIQDVGEVRHVSETKRGLSIAVELIGLSDPDVNELIRATNTASLRANSKGPELPDFFLDRRQPRATGRQ